MLTEPYLSVPLLILVVSQAAVGNDSRHRSRRVELSEGFLGALYVCLFMLGGGPQERHTGPVMSIEYSVVHRYTFSTDHLE